MVKRLSIAVLALLHVLAAPPVSANQLSDAKDAAYDIKHEKFFRAKGKPVRNRAICVFSKGKDPAEVARGQGLQNRIKKQWTVINGALFELSFRQLKGLLNNPHTVYCEQDAVVHLSADQASPTWGLNRIDQRGLPLDGNYHYDFDGTGIHAYILDTGIRTTHNDFGGRANWSTNTIDGNNSDCNGHGTHVAGTTGGGTYGVAKNVELYAVKVLDCNGDGTSSSVIDGINWVTNNRLDPAVANMSLRGGASSSIDNAVNNSVNSGVFYAVASGNDSADACGFSPGRASGPMTVGSTTSADFMSSFSNFGSCVDILAPGSSITSAWYTSNSATNTISGTSMASPHVAGAAALLLDENPGLSASQVKSALLANATTGVLSSLNGSPNLLLHSLSGGAPPPPPPPPPPGSCSGILFSDTADPGEVLTTANFSGGGTFSGHLNCTGGGNADIDLYLDLESCNFWGCTMSAVASSTSATCDEEISSFNGVSGTYRWRVVHFSGASEGFTLCVNQS